jgi:hypothetical protein
VVPLAATSVVEVGVVDAKAADVVPRVKPVEIVKTATRLAKNFLNIIIFLYW